jgi:hypothetical protein
MHDSRSFFARPSVFAVAFGCAIASFGMTASPADAAIITAADSASLDRDTSGVTAGVASMYIGDGGDHARYGGLFAFTLPDLGLVANPFQTASLSLTVIGTQTNNSFGNQQSPLVGLTTAGVPLARPTPTFLSTDNSSTTTPIGLSISYTNQTALGTYTTSGTLLRDYLNTAYAAGLGANQNVFFRLDPAGGLIFSKGFTVAGASNATEANRPVINYTAVEAGVPEPTGVMLAIAAAPLLLRRRKA